MTPTEEQILISSKAGTTSDNLLINALAGTGKTTTLKMIEQSLKRKPMLYLAFNKRIAEEAEKRFDSTTCVRTFNGLGHRVWAKACAKNLKLDPRKINGLFKDHVATMRKADANDAWDEYWNVMHAVGLARAYGYIPDGTHPQARRLITKEAFHDALDEYPTPLCADLIDEILTQSIKAGFIDFNDQIYMPALFGGTFPRFPDVAVDEYQDLNPCNHAMLDKLVKDRLFGVGDPWQSIYAFRGARQGGMAEAKQKFKMTECDLSVSFRCPEAIVEAAKWRVPKFRWMKSGGRVEHLREMEATAFDDNVAILSRNNAPLFRLAFRLLAEGRSVSVAGSEIGPKLVGIMRKLGDDSTKRLALIDLIDRWEDDKLAKGSKSCKDMADCMRVFAHHGKTLSAAVSYAEHLFEQKGSIRLLTGHKAKGLEWDTVYHLDPWMVGKGEQDLNLYYVIQTRSMNQYFEIDSENIHW